MTPTSTARESARSRRALASAASRSCDAAAARASAAASCTRRSWEIRASDASSQRAGELSTALPRETSSSLTRCTCTPAGLNSTACRLVASCRRRSPRPRARPTPASPSARRQTAGLRRAGPARRRRRAARARPPRSPAGCPGTRRRAAGSARRAPRVEVPHDIEQLADEVAVGLGDLLRGQRADARRRRSASSWRRAASRRPGTSTSSSPSRAAPALLARRSEPVASRWAGRAVSWHLTDPQPPQHRGGALGGELVARAHRRERHLRGGAKAAQHVGIAPLGQGRQRREAEQHAHRQQDQQHELGPDPHSGQQRDLACVRRRASRHSLRARWACNSRGRRDPARPRARRHPTSIAPDAGRSRWR